MGSTDSLRASLDRDGFVVIPGLLSSDEVASLREACSGVTTRARNGDWPHIRTLPKQFPPWSSDPSHGIWGVQHLLHPAQLDKAQFQRTYFHPRVTGAVSEIVDCPESNLVMELYNLLVRPDRDFALRWHRDDIPATASTAEEEKRLCADEGRQREYGFAQWNLALYDDQSLIVIPGSHRRARTTEEREADPLQDHIEGMMMVKLRPGDAVFYDNNILHRGVYDAEKERMTLHGTMSRADKAEERARNVLQHGVGEWVEQCDFSELDPQVKTLAEGMRKRLVEMGKGRPIEYSQPD